jgi:membrane fusion protein, heavy metal efflux system
MKNILFSAAILLFLAGCGNQNTPENTDATPATAASTEKISLTADQMQKSGIEVAIPTEQGIAAALTVNGTVAVLPEGKATVSSKIAGRVEQILVHEGQNVQKGQVLARVSTSVLFDIQQAYLQAKADLIYLEKELERQKTLSQQQVGAGKNYEEAQSKYARAKGDLEAAAAKLSYLGIGTEQLNNPGQLSLAKSVAITAPIAGNVSAIHVHLGAPVNEGTLLCNVVGLDHLHAHVEVFAKDIALVSPGQTAVVRFPNSSLPEINAKVEYISRELSTDSKTYSIHIPLPANGKNWLPGMPLQVDIHTNKVQALAVPEAALLHDGTETWLFVANSMPDGTMAFEKVNVMPTLRGGGWVALPDAGLTGKKVVVKGAHLIHGEMKRGEMAE